MRANGFDMAAHVPPDRAALEPLDSDDPLNARR
jgi:hypothetical protein